MHTYFHTTFGFCLWDLLALFVLVAMVIVLAVHITKQKKRQKELEKQLEARRAETGPDTPGR